MKIKRIVPKQTIIQCNGVCPFYRDYGDHLICSLSNHEFQDEDKDLTGFPTFCKLEIKE